MNNTLKHFIDVNSGKSQTVSGKVKKVDFHIHSRASFDADLSIPQILKMSQNAGVGMISITDHNTQKGVTSFLTPDQKKSYGAYVTMPSGVKVVPGMEVTCKHTLKNGEKVTLHLLIYAPKNLDDSVIGKLVELKSKHDYDADRGLIDYVNAETPYQITEKMLKGYIKYKQKSNPNFRRITVDDIASILIHDGQIKSRQQFLINYKKNYSKAQVDYISLELRDVVKLAKKAGALTLIAHPALSLNNPKTWKPFIRDAIEMGIDGIESTYYHPKGINANEFNRLFIAEKQIKGQKPILSGGTDAHNDKRVLGRVKGQPLLETEFSLVSAIEELHAVRIKEKEAFKLKTQFVAKVDKFQKSDLKPMSMPIKGAVIKNVVGPIKFANRRLIDGLLNSSTEISAAEILGIDVLEKYEGISESLKQKVYYLRKKTKK